MAGTASQVGGFGFGTAPPGGGLKSGSFDWILDWMEFKGYLLAWHSYVSSTRHPAALRALVIGCGTSPLSAHLGESGWFQSVVSIDNDPQCVSHMRRQHAGNSMLEWHVYDLVERTGSTEYFERQGQEGGFDLIVDKGTLDAILVEGVCSPMLSEVHRLLAAEGCYLLCSIHAKELLCPLLSTPILGLEIIKVDDIQVQSMAGSGSGSGGGTMMLLLKRTYNYHIDEQALLGHELEVMDFFYKEEQPLLSAEEFERVQAEVKAELLRRQTISLPLDAMHGVLFAHQKEGLDYSFELFLEDCRSFPLERQGEMTLPEALSFITQMQ